MFLVALELVDLVPSVTAGRVKKSGLSMPWEALERLTTRLHMECSSSMGRIRQASDVATAEIFPERLDC